MAAVVAVVAVAVVVAVVWDNDVDIIPPARFHQHRYCHNARACGFHQAARHSVLIVVRSALLCANFDVVVSQLGAVVSKFRPRELRLCVDAAGARPALFVWTLLRVVPHLSLFCLSLSLSWDTASAATATPRHKCPPPTHNVGL